MNIAPPASEATWFRLLGVRLENGTEDYPNGDVVQTVVPWTPPDTWVGMDRGMLNRILDDIDRGLKNGQRYSSASAATTRAAWPVVQQHAPDKTEKQCRTMIAAWVKSGTLFHEEYDDPIERKSKPGLRVNHGKRPS